MVEQVRMLQGLKDARALLAERYCAWWANHPDGIRHCAYGALVKTGADWMFVSELLDDTARALHPALKNGIAPRAANKGGNMARFDHFNATPFVYVNNQLGKEAILRVFDVAIVELEARVTAQAETEQRVESVCA